MEALATNLLYFYRGVQEDRSVTSLEDIRSACANTHQLVWFYTDWCGHCQRFEPMWQQLKDTNKLPVSFLRCDCDKHRDIATHYNVEGYPTLKLVLKGNCDQSITFEEERTPQNIKTWLLKSI